MNIKKISSKKFRLGDLNYDNRISILSFLPNDHINPRLNLLYRNENNDQELLGVVVKSEIEIQHGNMRRFLVRKIRGILNSSYIFKRMFGYFSTDPMRRIYIIENRTSIRLLLKGIHVYQKKYQINFKKLFPFRSSCLEFFIDRDRSFDLEKVDFNFSEIQQVRSLSIINDFDCSKIINNIEKQNLRLNHLSLFGRNNEDQNITIDQFHSILNRNLIVNISISSIDYSQTEIPQLQEATRPPRCVGITLGIYSSCNYFPPQFFYRFENVIKIFLAGTTRFVCDHDARDFFENIRKYAPRLRRFYIKKIETDHHPCLFGVGDLIEIMLKDNQSMRNFGVVHPRKSISQKLNHQIFKNEVCSSICFGDFSCSNSPLRKEFFVRLFPLVSALDSFVIMNNSADEAVINELPDILLNLPKKKFRLLKLKFPRLCVNKKLTDTIVYVCEDRSISSLNVCFRNMGVVIHNFLSLPKVHKMKVNVATGFGRETFQFDPYQLKRRDFELIRDNMTILKSFSFSFKDCEPLIYFLKYSRLTQHIQFATTNQPPFNLPSDFMTRRVNGVLMLQSFRDHLFFHEFESGVEYFETGFQPLVFRNFVRRRKEEFLDFQGDKRLFRSLTRKKNTKGNDDEQTTTSSSTTLVESRRGEKIRSLFQRILEEDVPNSIVSENNKELYIQNLEYIRHRSTTGDMNSIFLFGMDGSDYRVTESLLASIFNCDITYTCVLEFNSDENTGTEIKLSFAGFRMFSRCIKNGVVRYDFISPSTLDYLRYCVSQEPPGPSEQEKKEWISRKNFIRLICSMVGIDCKNGMRMVIFENDMEEKVLSNTEKTRIRKISSDFDMKWIFRESQRIYGLEFEELCDDNIDFIDCIFPRE